MKLFAFIKGIFSDDERVIEDITDRLIAAGFKILKNKYVHYTYEDGCDHYVEHKGRPYFDGLVNYVSKYPIYGFILETPENLSEEEAVALLRSLSGATMKIRPEYKDRRDELETFLPHMSIEEVEQFYILPEKGTIRYDIPVKYGYKFDVTKNVFHTSDSKASAEREIPIFENAVEREYSNIQ